MRSGHYFFTSESVTMGHPDKVSDQISDAILDAVLEQDPHGRVACETLVTTNRCVLAGEITTTALVDYPAVAREAIREIGYTVRGIGFDADTVRIENWLGRQSPDIDLGVSARKGKKQGAGDQGLMFGYACKGNDALMPWPILLAHRLVERLSLVRQEGILEYLRPDGKSQVTLEYSGRKPVRIDTVVISSHHAPGVDQKKIRRDIVAKVIRPILPKALLDRDTIIHVNPTGRFEVGGPKGDCGLTGRKIIVDSYGGWGRHGGGAFSGKDPSKVDRSAAYMCRYIAKNVVAANLADEAEIQLSYAIGVPDPTSVHVDTFGTAKVDERRIARAIREIFELDPAGIVRSLDLLRPIFRETARNGHFGRELSTFTWERTDQVEALRSLARPARRGGTASQARRAKTSRSRTSGRRSTTAASRAGRTRRAAASKSGRRAAGRGTARQGRGTARKRASRSR